MGVGKTTALINMMNANPDKRFIYITPYIKETERIHSACKNVQAVRPFRNSTKRDRAASLIKQGKSIATTHVLFKRFPPSVIEDIRNKHYTLIVDEYFNAVEPIKISKADSEMLFKSGLWSQDEYKMKWLNPSYDYEGKMYPLKCLCDYGMLYHMRDPDKATGYVTAMSEEVFAAFDDVYFSSYKTAHQPFGDYLYHALGGSLNPLFVTKDFQLTAERVYYDVNWRDLITVVDDPKLNAIGDNGLSKYRMTLMAKDGSLKKAVRALRSFWGNYADRRNRDFIWTTFESFKEVFKNDRLQNSFIPCNLRATNKYSDRHFVAYCCECNLDPSVESYLERVVGIKNAEGAFAKYAFVEMLQFIWRSAIRNGEPITVYIPSKKLREMFIEWLNLP